MDIKIFKADSLIEDILICNVDKDGPLLNGVTVSETVIRDGFEITSFGHFSKYWNRHLFDIPLEKIEFIVDNKKIFFNKSLSILYILGKTNVNFKKGYTMINLKSKDICFIHTDVSSIHNEDPIHKYYIDYDETMLGEKIVLNIKC